MLRFISSKIIKPKTQFVVVYDGIVPAGYSEISEFNKQFDDETLIYNHQSVLVNEYEDEKGHKVYPEVGTIPTKTLKLHK